MERVRRVVVVDDEADIVESISSLLEHAFPDVKVLPTQSPQEALQNAKGADLLVTDYRMPIMNGLELAQRAHKADSELPILIVTAYRDSFLQDEAGAMGVDVIHKPLDPGRFVDVVGAALAASS